MVSIAIIGYGKMGKEIEKAANEKGIEIKSIIDPKADGATAKEIDEYSMEGVDVAIDFTHPDVIMDNIRKVSGLGRNIVVGTTGWYGKSESVREMIDKSSTGLVWAPNFSLGVNLFLRIVDNASRIMDRMDDYDVFCHELHHNQKADSPSGTAGSIAETLLKNISRKKEMLTETSHERISPEKLHVTSTRAGSIPGTHMVGFDSQADTIELKHTARNRSGFALGAVLAAEWIKGKKGFFDINDMMDEMIRHG